MRKLATLLLIFTMSYSFGQLTLSTEVRPRFEYRHGFKTLIADGVDPATFISQRTRLNSKFSNDGLEVYLSVQNIRTWGDVKQLNAGDKNGIAIHQAWGKFNLSASSAIKLGRQVLAYDDQRFLGGVGWAQQARSHDAALYQYKKDDLKLDVGIAYNQDAEKIFYNTLNTGGTYKSLQYLWVHQDWDDFGASVLFANIGWQYIDPLGVDNDTRYNQTIGTHLKYTKNKFKVTSNIYYQFGKDVNDNDLNAYLLGIDLGYKSSDKTGFGLGAEIQTGNDNGVIVNNENNAFTPFFGTNHKFNGLMDYFYVGNHINSIGLVDIYANLDQKLSTASKLKLAFHNFSAVDFDEKQLGNEIDLVFSHKIQKYVTMAAGYSHMLPAQGMRDLKGVSDENTNNWGWMMITINPTIFTSNREN